MEHKWVVGVEIKHICFMISDYFCSKPVMSTSLRVKRRIWWFTILNTADRFIECMTDDRLAVLAVFIEYFIQRD